MPGRLFYGWLIVAASFVIFMVVYGLQFSFGVFLPHLMRDLGLDRAAASAPFSLYIFLYALLSIVTGRATDKLGPRTVVLTGGVLLGLGYLLLSRATTGWQIFVFFGVVAAAGMSASYVPLNATVVRWFNRRRGLALAVTGTGMNAAVLLVPMLSALLIPWLGWRAAMMVLGLGGGGVILFCALALVRDPGMRGLRPDGDKADSEPTDGGATEPLEISRTLDQARTDPSFWIILGVFFLTWVMVFFPYVHLPIMARDLGHDPASAASLVAIMGIGGFAGRVLIGWLSDRLGRMAGLHLGLGAQLLASGIFMQSDALAALYLAAALFGVGVSATITLFPAVLADVFGPMHVGAITGFMFAVAGGAAAIGPYAGGLIKDTSGSYLAAFLITASLNLAAIALVALLQLRQRA